MVAIKRISKSLPMKSNTAQREIYRVIGSTDIDGQGTEHEVHHIDPFIFLDEALMGEAGTTFSPHPHAGLCAVSHILSGEIKSWDNLNGELDQNNEAGGLYYISSGRGVVHSEVAIKPTHWLQLWLNPGVDQDPLPQAQAQLVKPSDIPVHHNDEAIFRVLMGDFYGCSSPVKCDWPVIYVHVVVNAQTDTTIQFDHKDWNGFVYVLKGAGQFGSDQTTATYQDLVEFDTKDGVSLEISNSADSNLEFMLAIGKPHGKSFAKLLGNGGAIVADSEEHARSSMSDFEADADAFGQ